jgi:MYXO-CTERM domain-containing protein
MSLLGACLGLALLAGPARATITYEYVTDQASYTGNVGDTVKAKVYLQETISGSSSSLINAENGMYSGGFYVFSPTNSSATITAVTTNSATDSSGFNGLSNTKFNATQARLTEDNFNVPFSGNGTQGVTNGNITTVFLGTVSITVGSASTTYTLESYRYAPKSFGGSGVDGNTLTWANQYDLDPTNKGSNGAPPAFTGANDYNETGSPFAAYTFTVSTSATPEPGSLVLGVVAASGLAVGAWRRRRKQA